MAENEKKDLTKADKAERIWVKLKVKAQEIGYGTFDCTVIVHDGYITEVQHWRTKESIRGDS
jgi:stalled ribosome rescue protein Dom34